MAYQNKIGFRYATGCAISEFVEEYFRDIAEPGMCRLDPSTVKTYRGTGESISNLCYVGRWCERLDLAMPNC
jgi:hypothetical protein